jgi:hypothetical protein
MRHRFLATALMALPALAMAQGSVPGTPRTPEAQQADTERGRGANFHMLDSNADGRISKTEAAADDRLGRAFNLADRNGDGFVDSDEYENHAKANSRAPGKERPRD